MDVCQRTQNKSNKFCCYSYFKTIIFHFQIYPCRALYNPLRNL